jgi:hypothetical protein
MSSPRVVAICALLAGCGGRATAAEEHAAGGTGPAAAGASAVEAVGGSEPAPSAEPLVPPAPPANIAGRWAMFNFEDPVGVLVAQRGAVLSGEGCAAGAPPLVQSKEFCGELHGNVENRNASFWFTMTALGLVTYKADVTISADGQRMAGRFHAVSDYLSYPTAWLRLPDDQTFLDRGTRLDEDPLGGSYALYVTDASAGATDYVPGKAYSARFFDRRFTSDLGCFWNTEISDPSAGSPLRVGPVPSTLPNLPTSLSIDFDAHGLTKLRAEMANAAYYIFDVTRAP